MKHLKLDLYGTGMPSISDPGSQLVAAAVAAGHRVVPLPGPSAVVSALVASGLPSNDFRFVGFLPPKSGARRKRFQSLKGAAHVLRRQHAFDSSQTSRRCAYSQNS